MHKDENEVVENLHNEFQLERMILFSDAVFAIVITLMAIEIKLPDQSDLHLPQQLLFVLPSILCYAITFFFIGSLWYRHLKIFGLLKRFNKTLVVLNLLMLFFIGIFPFSISVLAKNGHEIFASIIFYLIIVVCCKASQIALEYYILIKNPVLRNDADVAKEIIGYKKSIRAFFTLITISLLTISTFLVIPNPEYKTMAWCWFSIFPLVLKVLNRKEK